MLPGAIKAHPFGDGAPWTGVEAVGTGTTSRRFTFLKALTARPAGSDMDRTDPDGRPRSRPMGRRALLGLFGSGVAALAGCLDRDGPSDTPGGTPPPGTPLTETPPTGTPNGTTPTDSPTPSPTAPPSGDTTLEMGETFEGSSGVTETVEAVRVEKLIRTATLSGVHIDVAWYRDDQFGVVDVLEDPTREFHLRLDGALYPLPQQMVYRATPPGSHGFTGNPAFRIPVERYDEGAVVWRRPNDDLVEWTVPAETLAQFATQPAFQIRAFEAPESVSKGEAFYASFTVANTGDRDGRFITEFGAGPISDHGEVVVDVPVGETRTERAPMEPYYSEDAESVDVVLDWGKERLTRTVEVEQ